MPTATTSLSLLPVEKRIVRSISETPNPEDGVNPDPPPFNGNIVIDGNQDNSIVKIYNKTGSIVFRKALHQARNNLRVNTTEREWMLLRSAVGLDNVIEVSGFKDFFINRETGEDNQKFWYDAGFLRNKAYPGKAVAMMPVDGAVPETSGNSVGRKRIIGGRRKTGGKVSAEILPFQLQLVDEVEGNDRLYWIYNAAKKTFENGSPGTDRYVIEVRDGDYSHGHPVDVNKPSGQHREQFKLVPDPDSRELEILNMTFDLSRAINTTAPVSLFRMTNRNNSPAQNTVKIEQEEIRESNTTEIFYWEKDWVVDGDFAISIALPYVNNGIHFGDKTKKTVGGSSETKNTHTQKWSFETPITVPPHSKVIFQMTVQQGKLSVPFTANMRRGRHVWQEDGWYEGVNYFNLDVTIDVTDLKLRV